MQALGGLAGRGFKRISGDKVFPRRLYFQVDIPPQAFDAPCGYNRPPEAARVSVRRDCAVMLLLLSRGHLSNGGFPARAAVCSRFRRLAGASVGGLSILGACQ